uniref:Kelch domain-containing protein 3 n=2 Tax=Clastoptera arizonana TaxID=38151 RepID=A0A1B6DWJ7_9HEMI
MYWTVHLEGGPRRVNHAAVLIEDKIYSFGGYCTGEDYKLFRPMDVHVLNTATLRWKALNVPTSQSILETSEAPFQRYGHSAVAHGKNAFIWGGRNDEAVCKDLFCFNTETATWKCIKTYGTCPGARDGHSACIINDCMYIFGGFEEDIDRFSQDVFALNLQTMYWTYVQTKGIPPTYRDFHSATAIGLNMYIFGGRGDRSGALHSQVERYCHDIMYLDTRNAQWHRPVTMGDIPIGRRSHSAFVHDGKLYIFGGYNSLREEHFNDLHRFCPKTLTWQHIKAQGEPPTKRRRQSCVVLGDRMFLFGGTSPGLSEDDEDSSDSSEYGVLRLMDHDDLHILDFRPSLFLLCLMSVITHRLDTSSLPQDVKMQLKLMTMNNNIRPRASTG